MPFFNILNMYSTLCPERLCTFCNLAVNGLQLRFTWPPLYLDAALPAAEDRGVVTLSPRNNSGPCSMTSRMLPHTVRQGLGNWIQLAYSLSRQWKALAANRMWSMPGETERKDRLGLELCARKHKWEHTQTLLEIFQGSFTKLSSPLAWRPTDTLHFLCECDYNNNNANKFTHNCF